VADGGLGVHSGAILPSTGHHRQRGKRRGLSLGNAWNQRVWAGLLGTAAFGFCHLLLNPSSGYLADSTRTSLFTVIWLLVAFGGGSVLFWAYFRFRPQPAANASPPPPMPSGEPPMAA
jgi:hypothetical protein